MEDCKYISGATAALYLHCLQTKSSSSYITA